MNKQTTDSLRYVWAFAVVWFALAGSGLLAQQNDASQDSNKPRELSFAVNARGHVHLRPSWVFVNDQPVKLGDTFAPGKYKLLVQFHGYKTVLRNIVIPPGEGYYEIEVDAEKLEQYEFRIGKKYVDINGTLALDGLLYSLEIYVDELRVEPYHVVYEGAPGGIMYGHYFAPQDAHHVRMMTGFYYDDSPIKPQIRFLDLSKIDINRLLHHLAEADKKSSTAQSLWIMDRLLKSKVDAAKIKNTASTDRIKLVNFLRELKVSSSTEHDLQKSLQRELE